VLPQGSLREVCRGCGGALVSYIIVSHSKIAKKHSIEKITGDFFRMRTLVNSLFIYGPQCAYGTMKASNVGLWSPGVANTTPYLTGDMTYSDVWTAPNLTAYCV
jgi:hypothetical protein